MFATEKGKKWEKKGWRGERRSEVTFLSFFPFFFRGKYRARYTDTACSCAKLQPAMLRSYIMHTRVYTYTGCSKTPVYRATGVTDKLQRVYMPQAPGLTAATMVVGKGRRFFIRLETSPSNFVDKNCCKKRISL